MIIIWAGSWIIALIVFFLAQKIKITSLKWVVRIIGFALLVLPFVYLRYFSY